MHLPLPGYNSKQIFRGRILVLLQPERGDAGLAAVKGENSIGSLLSAGFQSAIDFPVPRQPEIQESIFAGCYQRIDHRGSPGGRHHADCRVGHFAGAAGDIMG